MANMVTCSIDGRLSWELDTKTGVLVGMLPNGTRLQMHAEDTRRLKQLLAEYSDIIDAQAEKVLASIGEYHKPIA